MNVMTKHDGMVALKSILAGYNDFIVAQQKELEGYKKSGLTVLPEKAQAMKNAVNSKRESALMRISNLQNDYIASVKALYLPFSIDGEEITGFTRGELSFLQSLQFLRMSPAQCQEYARHFEIKHDVAMTSAICGYAQSLGYKVAGGRNVDKDIEEFEQACGKGRYILTCNRDDAEQSMIADSFRQQIDEGIQQTSTVDGNGIHQGVRIYIDEKELCYDADEAKAQDRDAIEDELSTLAQMGRRGDVRERVDALAQHKIDETLSSVEYQGGSYVAQLQRQIDGGVLGWLDDKRLAESMEKCKSLDARRDERTAEGIRQQLEEKYSEYLTA